MNINAFGKPVLLAKDKKSISQKHYITNCNGFILVKAHNPHPYEYKSCVYTAGVYLNSINEYFCITGGTANGDISPSSLSIPIGAGEKFSIHGVKHDESLVEAEVAFYFVPVELHLIKSSPVTEVK